MQIFLHLFRNAQAGLSMKISSSPDGCRWLSGGVPNGPDVIKRVIRPDWKRLGETISKWIDLWNREVIQ
jgi:hypothetical protein